MKNKKWVTKNVYKISKEKLKITQWNEQENSWFPRNTLHSCRSCIIKIYAAGCRSNWSNESHYPRDDDEIVADDRSTAAQAKLASCCCDDWLRPKIWTKENMVTWCKKLKGYIQFIHYKPCIHMPHDKSYDQKLNNVSQMWNRFVFYLSSQNNLCEIVNS